MGLKRVSDRTACLVVDRCSSLERLLTDGGMDVVPFNLTGSLFSLLSYRNISSSLFTICHYFSSRCCLYDRRMCRRYSFVGKVAIEAIETDSSN